MKRKHWTMIVPGAVLLCASPAFAVDLREAVQAALNSNPEIRQNLPKVSDWPTFPQLFVDGELVGGCDIMTEMYEAGELKQLLDDSAAKRAQA